jgi:hypothetical protein
MSETEVKTEVQLDDTDNLDTFADDFFGQKKPATTETKVEVEQDGEVQEGTETEAQEEVDPNAEADAEYKEAPPKKKTVQDRIDEVVRQREEIRRESEEKIAALRQEFEAFKAGAPKADVKATDVAEPKPEDTKEDGSPKYELGEFDPAYIRDLTRFTLNQETTRAQVVAQEAQRVAQENQARQALQTDWNTKLETAKTEYPDLEVKVRPLLDSFNGLDSNYAGYLSTVLMSMDKGPDVLYYLSNHPEEATTIVNSGAQKATLALGRIEAKFLEADAEKQLAKPKISKAPPPPSERARGTNGAFIAVNGDEEDLDQFSQAFFTKK